MRIRRYAASAVLTCVAAMAACTAASEFPTLEAATEQLTADADHLLGASGLRLPAAEQVRDDSCVPGEVRAFLRIEGELVDASVGLLEKLQAMGYDKVVDDLDLRDDAQDVVVLRHPETRLTFELTVVDGDKPGVRIVGKTTCYATAH
uniref:hypothetical protein n=1 Tax=Nonomuraea sp. SYSU D8015 TaxID=2593644 RepID=UPI0016606748|nr:hypothetical protein [Nonomuraea sp. SYSU D8015]